jgi:hypothetical protein
MISTFDAFDPPDVYAWSTHQGSSDLISPPVTGAFSVFQPWSMRGGFGQSAAGGFGGFGQTQADGGFGQPAAAPAFGAAGFGQPAANTFGGASQGSSGVRDPGFEAWSMRQGSSGVLAI